jgi:hypothetical protein
LRVSAWPRPVSLVTACPGCDSLMTALLNRVPAADHPTATGPAGLGLPHAVIPARAR